MKAARMHGLDVAELQRQAQDAQDQLFRLRFQMGMGQMEGLKKFRNLKKDRARMLTVLGEKHAAGETAPPVAATKPAPKKTATAKKRASAAGESDKKRKK